MNANDFRWRNWGIGSRLMFITFVPVITLFVAIILHSYQTRIADSREELTENCQIISAALAASSEYSVISGNYSDIKLLIVGLINADRSIVQIEILDDHHKLLLHEISTSSQSNNDFGVEVPILKTAINFNVFDDLGDPQVSDQLIDTEKQAHVVQKDIIGYVRVTMTQDNMLNKQALWLATQAKILISALLVCVVVTILLTRSLTKPLALSIKALHQIKSGSMEVSVPVTTGGEIGTLQESISEMSRSLAESKRHLELKISERTRDLQESRDKVMKSDEEKRKLIQKVHSIVEDERKSIAIEIHDELNSSLIAARLNADKILGIAMKMEQTADLVEITTKATAIVELVRHLYSSSRKIVRQLRPEVLDMLGLSGAIEDIIRQYNTNHPSCIFYFKSEGDFSILDSHVSIASYRIIQEALSNIVKHAKATSVSASLILRDDNKYMDIQVSDNGVGFDTSRPTGMGILGMRERVLAFGGKIDIVSSIGQSTTYSVTIPLCPDGFVERRATDRMF